LSAGGTTVGSDAESKDPDNVSPAIPHQGVLSIHSVLVFKIGNPPLPQFLCVSKVLLFQILAFFGNFGDFGNLPQSALICGRLFSAAGFG
jgi:hypothetical protein